MWLLVFTKPGFNTLEPIRVGNAATVKLFYNNPKFVKIYSSAAVFLVSHKLKIN
jgi:hypothetical protein